MLDRDTRMAILALAKKGYGIRRIARALKIDRKSVRSVLASGECDVPKLVREEQLGAHLEEVRRLHDSCEGNIVRVREELEVIGIETGYSSLTAFCRRQGIGVEDKERAGRYVFEPGEEMQHDTSPHKVTVGGRERALHCASLVLCYSRMLFAQAYPRWGRFECKVFLTAALTFFDAVAGRCMLDNSTVIIAHGTGRHAVPAAEMAAFAKRFGFVFAAHRVGDADRSARVETNFGYIEGNFYPGRTFDDLADLNAQMRTWCDKVNRNPRRLWGQSRAVPFELFVAEKPALQRLPLHVPEVYDLHVRKVDVEGYVTLHTNRYSVPAQIIGRRVEVRESIDRVRVFDGHQLVIEHGRLERGEAKRVTHPDHKRDGRWNGRASRSPGPALPEEKELRAVAPELGALVDALRKRHGGRAAKAIKRLHRFFRDYPSEPLIAAVRTGLDYGLLDLARIERMVLRRIAGDFFQLPVEQEPDDDKEEDNDG